MKSYAKDNVYFLSQRSFQYLNAQRKAIKMFRKKERRKIIKDQLMLVFDKLSYAEEILGKDFKDSHSA